MFCSMSYNDGSSFFVDGPALKWWGGGFVLISDHVYHVSLVSLLRCSASTASSLLSFLSHAVYPKVPYWGQYNSFRILKI